MGSQPWGNATYLDWCVNRSSTLGQELLHQRVAEKGLGQWELGRDRPQALPRAASRPLRDFEPVPNRFKISQRPPGGLRKGVRPISPKPPSAQTPLSDSLITRQTFCTYSWASMMSPRGTCTLPKAHRAPPSPEVEHCTTRRQRCYPPSGLRHLGVMSRLRVGL